MLCFTSFWGGNPKVPTPDKFIWDGQEDVCEVAIWWSSQVHQAYGGCNVVVKGVQREITGNQSNQIFTVPLSAAKLPRMSTTAFKLAITFGSQDLGYNTVQIISIG